MKLDELELTPPTHLPSVYQSQQRAEKLPIHSCLWRKTRQRQEFRDIKGFHFKAFHRGGGGDRGVTISRFPYPVLPPPVRFCPFVSRLPPFIVFLPLSRKSRCLTTYSDSNRECFGLVQNKKIVL